MFLHERMVVGRLRQARHVWVFLVVYALLVALVLGPLERRTLLEGPRHLAVYARAQNFAAIRFNAVKGGILLAVWPFVAGFSPVTFVESGAFSMCCFALACRAAPDCAVRASCKLFWHRLFESVGLPTPTLVATSDATARCTVWTTGVPLGVRKPLRSMYGLGVNACSLCQFLQTPLPNQLLQERVDDPHEISYRICTLRTLRATSARAIFVMTLRGRKTRIALGRWRALRAFGARLATVHAARLPWAPLVGWDVMHDRRRGFVVLEGNLGGSFGFHAIPAPSDLGWVDGPMARAWIDEVRQADRAGLFR